MEPIEWHGRRVPAAGVLLLMLALLLLTRLPLAPHYLYYFDSVNFALAMDDFNPAKHQPQPPGYPAFVLATRALHAFLPSPEQVLVVAGLCAAAAALVLVWRVGAAMFGVEAGVLAAALLVLNPPFWLGGVTNQVRLCLALNSGAVALVSWLALRDRKWFFPACLVLGTAAGFRPVETSMLIPLVVFVWWRSGGGWTRLMGGGALAVLAVLPWVAITVSACGGLSATAEVLRSYSREQFSGTSMLFGAAVPNAVKMAAKAALFNGIGTLAWIWAVPLVRFRLDWERGAFLAIWFVPAFVFGALVHIGDPDQALLTIPVLCVLGGAVLASLRRPVVAIGWALAANALLFVSPPRVARAASYEAVHTVDERVESVIDSVRELSAGRDTAIVHYGAIVTWRHLFYYFPDERVVYLPDNRGEGCMTLFRRELEDNQRCSTELPRASRYILVAPFLNGDWLAERGWKRSGTVYWRDAAPGTTVEIGPYKLRM